MNKLSSSVSVMLVEGHEIRTVIYFTFDFIRTFHFIKNSNNMFYLAIQDQIFALI